MQKKLLASSIIAFSMVVGLSASAQDKDVQKARKHVAEAKKDLKEAKIDSAEDYRKFVEKADQSISQNKKIIAGLRSKANDKNKAEQEKYNKRILALESKNDELAKRIKDSRHTKTNSWERFKLDFNRDVQKLGEDIKRI
jgi:hypothetical protein